MTKRVAEDVFASVCQSENGKGGQLSRVDVQRERKLSVSLDYIGIRSSLRMRCGRRGKEAMER